jgi:uncharacterized protein (DUF952 family)
LILVCSSSRQVAQVANRFFDGHSELIVLRIPLDALNGKDLRWEAPVHPSAERAQSIDDHALAVAGLQTDVDRFPHLYGCTLTMDMVSEVLTLKCRNACETGGSSFDMDGLRLID